ncbi:MAG: methyltransferase [Proteobacteria bacterium]|nr:MAG: methyltransferase [Pseudomonadota bacterium]
MADKESIRTIMMEVTKRTHPPLTPELSLRLVTADSPWWSLNPRDLESMDIPEPFWAFAWGGGQSLARYILDNPSSVAGKSVIDFGAGGGIVSLAALEAGAAHVTATEIDPWAIVALEENLRPYEGRFELSCEDWIGRNLDRESVLLCGDMSYERELCERLMQWFGVLKVESILIGDPGRGFIDKTYFKELASYLAPTDSDADGRYKVRSSVLAYITSSGS